jgi:hypothetical protein
MVLQATGDRMCSSSGEICDKDQPFLSFACPLPRLPPPPSINNNQYSNKFYFAAGPARRARKHFGDCGEVPRHGHPSARCPE